jgi:hypothetical protein
MHSPAITKECFINSLDIAVKGGHNKTAATILFQFNRRFLGAVIQYEILDQLLQRLVRSLNKDYDAVKALLEHIAPQDKAKLYRRLSPSIVMEMMIQGVGELPDDLIQFLGLIPAGEQYKQTRPFVALVKALDTLASMYNKDKSYINLSIQQLFPNVIISAGSEIEQYVLLKSEIKTTLVEDCELPSDLVENAIICHTLGMSCIPNTNTLSHSK